MRNALILLLTILAYVPESYAKDLFELFQKHIPKEIIQKEGRRELISEELERKANLNPKLIYYYLKFHQLQGRKPFVYQSSLEREEAQKRREWALEQINNIKKMDLKYSIKTDAIKQFDQFTKTHFTTPKKHNFLAPYEIDQNKLHYFVVIYYTGNGNMPYNSETNYKQLRDKLEKEKTDHFINLLNNPRASNLHPDILKDLFNNWHLFNFTSHKRNYSTGMEFTKWILQLVEQKYLTKKNPKYSLQFGYAGFNKTISFENVTKIPVDNKTYVINENFNFPQFVFSGSYKWQLNKFLQRFSYINFSIAFALNSTESSIHFYNKRYIKYLEPDQRDQITIEKELTDFSLKTIQTKITTPIFTYKNKMVIQPGILFGIHNLKFASRYNYEHIIGKKHCLWTNCWYETFSRDGSDGWIEENESIIKYVFRPGFDLEVQLPLQLSGIVSYYIDYLSCSLGYNF